MKAQLIRSFGNPGVFELADVEKPNVIPGHVLIKVKASSVNPIDTKIRAGLVPAISPELPAILHGDVAGIIEAVGDGVEAFKVGDEVYGCAGGFKGTGGALAEYMLADSRLLAKKPFNLSFEEAAALPLVSITAWEALVSRGEIMEGQKVLIHAAAGGVGHIAVQLAKSLGAKVYTTASTEEKLKIGRDFGADTTINYKTESVADYVEKYTDGKGFEIVFDTVGGENLDRSFEAAAMGGKVLAIAARSTHNLTPLHNKGLSLHVVFMLLKIINEAQRHEHGKILNQITKLAEEGKIKPLLDEKRFTFEEAAKAHDYLENGKPTGKVVLVNTW